MLRTQVVGIGLALASAWAGAAPFLLSFEVEREVPRGIGGDGLPMSTLPKTSYRIQVDLAQPARILFLDGSVRISAIADTRFMLIADTVSR